MKRASKVGDSQVPLWTAFKPKDERPGRTWPDSALLPHNEDASVANIVEADLAASADVLIVTGYASLDRIITFLAGRHDRPSDRVRILFGNEPFASRRDGIGVSRRRLSDEMRDYWLRRGVSVSLSSRIIAAREVLDHAGTQVRIAAGRPQHAKIYVTERTVTLGSSNYTDRGFRSQSEANARFTTGEDRESGARLLAEGFWLQGEDYRKALADLLDRLLQQVTWQEALSRACAEVLAGEWARRYVPPDEIDALGRPLWPHQLQGISQALYAIIHEGSVLVADATGSGKTRMGAWLLRAAYDRQVRGGNGRRNNPLLVSPPPIVESWKKQLAESGLACTVESHGPLSNVAAAAHERLTTIIGETELLAVDEAHNFVNPSSRTYRMLSHYADNVVLFTATPINKGAADLLAMVELLGADNFSDATLDRLQGLARLRRAAPGRAGEAVMAIKRELQRFLVRRTRSELNEIAVAAPEQYRLEGGRSARYPHHRARYYDVPALAEDLSLAKRIEAMADELLGVARVGKQLRLPKVLEFEGYTEEQYARRLVSSAKALARHVVMECLRSSRAALYEHIHGTDAAVLRLKPGGNGFAKNPTGNTLLTIEKLAGHPPEWHFTTLEKGAVEPWLSDPDAHREACEHDAELYRKIAEFVAEMSPCREDAKVDRLAQLRAERGKVIAFDSHVLTLAIFERVLEERGEPAALFTGEGGAAAKRKAADRLGNGGDAAPLIALCSDAFSEGMNLQGAACVVHLDTPTVIRTAEQRAGRVDRMDSRHDTIEIWWPRDPPDFAPRKKELLRERHDVVQELIGANLHMPDDRPIVEFLAEQANIERPDEPVREEDPRSLLDAFRPVRELVGENGLVTAAQYEAMRTSQVRVASCVGAVDSDRPWAFFAVGGADRAAPRWVLIEGPDDGPVADLAEIAARLRERLGPETTQHPIDARATLVMDEHLERLRVNERKLLPMRRQRALTLAERVLNAWQQKAWSSADAERRTLLKDLAAMLSPPAPGAEFPDPRAVADAWLRVFRPVQRRALEHRGKRRRVWRLDDLEAPLVRDPVSTETLRRAFDEIPLLQPVAERIVAMIVGVPADNPSAVGAPIDGAPK